MEMQEQTIVADAAAREWAQVHVDYDKAELVGDSPWAKSYRLSGVHDIAYLKILPAHQASVLEPVAALARRFPTRIPQVLAYDAALGWIVSAEHGGRTLDYGAASDDLVALVQTYAHLQAEAVIEPALFQRLPQPVIADLPELLLDFLQSLEGQPQQGASAQTAPRVGAGYFLGRDEAARYHRVLKRRVPLLRRHLRAATELPVTINHGDLRPPNAAIAAAGGCVILDWDDAMVGPAGMSLHQLFGGCTIPTVLLSGSAAAQAASESPEGTVIRSYVETLAEAGYADSATLLRCLPSSMCAGVIQFILNFARFPGEGERELVRGTMERRLDNLLDLCDWLAARDPAAALELAREDQEDNELERAQNLLMDYTARHPEDVAVAGRLAALLRQRGEFEDAAEEYGRAVELAPQDAALRAALAEVMMERLDLEGGRRESLRALDLDPGLAGALATLGRVRALEELQQRAAIPEQMPRLSYSLEDLAAERVRPEMLALGTSLFDTYGTMQVDNAFPVEMIAALHDAFMDRYSAYFREDNHPDALRLGDKRYMLTVDLEPPFDATSLIGAPMVLPIIRKVLGDDCVLGAYTAVISLPGSEDQRIHKDHPSLFPDTEWHFSLPCFAAQIIIPLIPLDEMSGTTRFFKGSHRFPTEDARRGAVAQDPVVPLGSCLLNDYRCAHRGRGNRSDRVRPILTVIFNRPWFRDFKNYGKQPPLRMDEASYARLPRDLRRLVDWRREELAYERMRHSLLR